MKTILLILFLVTVANINLSAQPVILPSVGLQTLTFAVDTGHILVQKLHVLGANFSGPHNGFRLQAELLLDKNSIIRFPISLEGFFIHGVETQKALGPPIPLTVSRGRVKIMHDAMMFSGNIGLGLTWLRIKKYADFYATAEAKLNYLPPTTISASYFDASTDVEYQYKENTTHKDSWFRVGSYFKGGIQVPFFEPLMIDFSGGYGFINLLGKYKEEGQHTLFSVDRDVHEPETTIPYWGLGLSLIYKLN